MSTPTLEACTAYLGDDVSWTPEEIEDAYDAEVRSQRNRCKIPRVEVDVDHPDGRDYPDDLVDALYRRVAHNLALRALPLGVQANATDAAVAVTQVGGLDAEVRRLEAPYRKRALG